MEAVGRAAVVSASLCWEPPAAHIGGSKDGAPDAVPRIMILLNQAETRLYP